MSDAAAAAAAFLGGNANSGGGGKKKKKKGKKKGGSAAQQAAKAVDETAPAAPATEAKPTAAPAAGGSNDAADAALAFLGVGAESGGGGGGGKKKKKKGKKKPAAKKPSAMALKIQKQQAEQKAREEALQKAREEEDRLAQIEAEKEAAVEEAKRLKRQKKKERKAQLKAEGKIKTKAQKEAEAKAAAARKQLIDSGMVAGFQESDGPKKKVVYGKKKKKKVSPKEEERKRLEAERLKAETEARAKLESEEAAKANAAEGGDDDWENLADEKDEGDENEDWEDELADDWEDMDLDDLEVADKDDSDEEVNEAAKKKKEALKKAAAAAAAAEEDGSDDDESSDEDPEDLDAARAKREERRREALAARSKDDLRSPILCVLGHVDTGKTKILDKIRRTNVQDGEAGGITQQIGATYMPIEDIRTKTAELNKDLKLDLKVPGLLVIDTPGHESFTNLRSRGSGLCDISILVIDIMHGLEPQTIESINLLRSRKTPFIVAMNKVDRLYDWKVCKNAPFRKALAAQKRYVIEEFENRCQSILGELMAQGLNASLYYENEDFRKVVSVVPTSAHSGEGIPDLLLLSVQMTQELMTKKIMYSSAFECTCLEVKSVEGLGTTIDVILINGVIKDSDTIVVCGTKGAIVTKVRALLTPRGMRDIRVKNDYQKNKEIKAAMGIKVAAQNMENAVAGTNVLVYRKEEGDNLEELKMTVQEELDAMLSRVSVDGRGVYVQASTLGALEALLEFLKESKIPVSAVSIGPVFKKDVMRASVMLEHQVEYATILAFDVKVDKDATALATELGVKIMTAEIIYHLFDQFTLYLKQIKEQRRNEASGEAVFPVCLAIKSDCIFMKKAPIVLGCDVIDGILKIGTPICVPDIKNEDGEPLMIGKVSSIEKDHVETNMVKKGNAVAVKFEPTADSLHVTYGRHFDFNNTLYSKLTRGSIDALKENFKDDLGKEDWRLVIKMKKIFNIV